MSGGLASDVFASLLNPDQKDRIVQTRLILDRKSHEARLMTHEQFADYIEHIKSNVTRINRDCALTYEETLINVILPEMLRRLRK